jgi:hypothetical protein
VLAGYGLLNPASETAGRLAAKYPTTSAQRVCARKDLGRAEIGVLEPILGRAWLVLTAMRKAAANPKAA